MINSWTITWQLYVYIVPIWMAFSIASAVFPQLQAELFPKYRLSRSAVGVGVTAVGNLFTKDRGTNFNPGQSPQPIRFSIFLFMV